MIDKIHLKNFTVFDEVELDFSPKVNLIIGENGTGKTHLLKAAYGVCSGRNPLLDSPNGVSRTQLKDAISEQLIRCFLPPDSKIGLLSRSHSNSKSEINVDFATGKSLGVTFGQRSKGIQFSHAIAFEDYSWHPIFLPSKDCLLYTSPSPRDS